MSRSASYTASIWRYQFPHCLHYVTPPPYLVLYMLMDYMFKHAIQKILLLCIFHAFFHLFLIFLSNLPKESLDSQSPAAPEPEYHLSSVSGDLRGDKRWEVPRHSALHLHSRLRFVSVTSSSFVYLFSFNQEHLVG